MTREDEIERERFLAHSCRVYYVRRISDGMIKIGYSTMIKERLRGLRAEFGELQLLMTHSGGRAEEEAAHEQFAAYRIPRTEWFRPAKPLLCWIGETRQIAKYRETQWRDCLPIGEIEKLIAVA